MEITSNSSKQSVVTFSSYRIHGTKGIITCSTINPITKINHSDVSTVYPSKNKPISYPRCSMYGSFTYIYHKTQPQVNIPVSWICHGVLDDGNFRSPHLPGKKAYLVKGLLLTTYLSLRPYGALRLWGGVAP